MNTQIIVWTAVVGLFVLLLIAKALLTTLHRGRNIHAIHIISKGSEREELFVPGDPICEEDVCDDED